MKVVLLSDDKKLGKKGEIVSVSDGYVISALLPQKKVKIATSSILKQAKKDEIIKKENEIKQRNSFEKDAKKLSGNSITIAVNAEGKKVFGSVGQLDIVEAIKVKYNLNLDSNAVTKEHIKTIGDHEISINFGLGVSTKMTLKIVAK